MLKWFLFMVCLILLGAVQVSADWIIDPNGEGDFLTVTEAIDALDMYSYQRNILFIRNGIYHEKIRIDQNYITLRGENADSTIICYSQLRSEWQKKRDFTGPAVVNLYGDDIILENLTIENTQPEIGPHAFAVFGTGTRTIILNCRLLSKGADTVSLWNYKSGMYYHARCVFQGAVDFICPRGWCYIRDSEFYELKKTASIWHAGHYDSDQKLVVVHSHFDGVPGFELGRHHYDAQFYLIECVFSERMADQPIYRQSDPQAERNNPDNWGDRNYFYRCQGPRYQWIQDNLPEISCIPPGKDFTPLWTFEGTWDPESREPLKIVDFELSGNRLKVIFDEPVTVRGEPELRSESGESFQLLKLRAHDNGILTFISKSPVQASFTSGEIILKNGEIIASTASAQERSTERKFRIE